ncbi:MAG: TetR/AcrR family transcriptional regulator [bacterium]|nr:TetR/AcrR family transcriptional regulator [bacterium]
MRTREGNKKQDILDAAIQVFAESGYYNAKISRIAETAGVATGSVYLYFHNKEDILFTLFDRIWLELSEQLQVIVDRQDITPEQKLDGLIDMVFGVLTNNPSLAIVFVNEQSHLIQKGVGDFNVYYENFLDLGEKVLQEGMDNGEFSPDINLKIIRLFTFGGMHHLIQKWAQSPDSYPVEVMRQQVKSLIKKGIKI